MRWKKIVGVNMTLLKWSSTLDESSFITMEGNVGENTLGDRLVYLTLSQAISQDASILKPAEEKLCEWETHPGFYSSLSVSEYFQYYDSHPYLSTTNNCIVVFVARK